MAFKMKGPLKHMGYEVNIKKGKVVGEKEKPHNKFKTETEHEEYHDAYPSKPFTDAEGKPFKMKGSPMKRNFGIGADSPMKETTTQVLQGMNFNPYAYKGLSADDIPSFRDMVSLEQQQAARKAWKDKRAKRKQEKQDKIDKHFADKKLIKDAKEGKLTGKVETINTTEGQENTTPIIPRDINIVTNGKVTGSTSTSSIPDLEDYEAGSVDNPNEEEGLNINTSNSLW